MGSPRKRNKKTFEELAADAGLNATSVTRLAENDYDSITVVVTIQAEELEKLQLSLGQKGMLRAWVEKLKPPPKKTAASRQTAEAAEAAASGSTSGLDPVTLDSLRSQDGIDSKIQRRIRALGLADDDDSGDEAEPQAHTGRGKKSGRVTTADDLVKRHTLWPQMHIHRPGADKPPPFNTLTQQEFVYGFMCDMEDCVDEAKKRRLWLRLHELMMDAMFFGWEAARGFHGVFLQNIEQGRMDWASDVTTLKTQYMLAPLGKQATSTIRPADRDVRGSTFDRKEYDHPSSGPLFCVPFQTGACKMTGDGHDTQRGPVKHVCAYCLKSAGKLCRHPEDSCIRRTKTSGDTY